MRGQAVAKKLMIRPAKLARTECDCFAPAQIADAVLGLSGISNMSHGCAAEQGLDICEIVFPEIESSEDGEATSIIGGADHGTDGKKERKRCDVNVRLHLTPNV
jgi:hypothetical protein